MTSRIILSLVIVGGVLAPGAPPVCAELITFQFTGEVTSVWDPNGFLGGGVAQGSLVSGEYTFESTTPDTSASSDDGEYTGALTSITGAVGGLWFQGPAGSTNFVSVHDEFNYLGGPDTYNIGTGVDLLGETMDFQLGLADSTALVFTSDALPLEPPSLDDFDWTQIRMLSESVSVDILGEVTSLTPEPGTLLFLGLGTLLVVGKPWKARALPFFILALLVVMGPAALVLGQDCACLDFLHFAR